MTRNDDDLADYIRSKDRWPERDAARAAQDVAGQPLVSQTRAEQTFRDAEEWLKNYDAGQARAAQDVAEPAPFTGITAGRGDKAAARSALSRAAQDVAGRETPCPIGCHTHIPGHICRESECGHVDRRGQDVTPPPDALREALGPEPVVGSDFEAGVWDEWKRTQRVLAALRAQGVVPPDALRSVIADGIEAMRLTREYVGEATLPAIGGWSWYDWTIRAAAALDPEYAKALEDVTPPPDALREASATEEGRRLAAAWPTPFATLPMLIEAIIAIEQEATMNDPVERFWLRIATESIPRGTTAQEYRRSILRRLGEARALRDAHRGGTPA